MAAIRPVAKADIALVLGASARRGIPTPVFAARIDHAIELLEKDLVRTLLFTGGRGDGENIPDSQAAKNYALGKGVPEERILIETTSRTTRENLSEARLLLPEDSSITCLLVSDPLHMFRACQMMKDAGISGLPAPTPHTRIRGFGQKLRFFIRELWLYQVYLVTGN